MRVIAALFLVVSVLLGATQTAHAQPTQRGCHFRNAIWHDVHVAADDVRLAGAYASSDEVDTDKAPLDEHLQRMLSRYSMPRGWNLLETSWIQVWSHLWGVGYWNAQMNAASADDSMSPFYVKQRNTEWTGAWNSLATLWVAAKAMC